MLGNSKFNDKSFTGDNYEEFYSHHHFQPLSEVDALNCHEVIPRFSWAFDKIEEFAAGKKNLRLLDLGCLDGSFCLTVAKHLGIECTGVDLTQDGIDIARERELDNALKCNFYQGFVEDWLQKFIDEGKTFDIVTWFEIIEHVDSPGKVQRLIDQVVKHDGIIMCSTPAFESPNFGMDDEQNKCHVRLYTTQPRDYRAVNKYGNTRTATSMPAFLGEERIIEMGVYSELINVLYK